MEKEARTLVTISSIEQVALRKVREEIGRPGVALQHYKVLVQAGTERLDARVAELLKQHSVDEVGVLMAEERRDWVARVREARGLLARAGAASPMVSDAATETQFHQQLVALLQSSLWFSSAPRALQEVKSLARLNVALEEQQESRLAAKAQRQAAPAEEETVIEEEDDD